MAAAIFSLLISCGQVSKDTQSTLASSVSQPSASPDTSDNITQTTLYTGVSSLDHKTLCHLEVLKNQRGQTISVIVASESYKNLDSQGQKPKTEDGKDVEGLMAVKVSNDPTPTGWVRTLLTFDKS